MKSIKDIYKMGKGPSSSHTMGPYKAITSYMEKHPEADRLHVTLYGSLAATGKGHLTDEAVHEAFAAWHTTDRDTAESRERLKDNVTIEWKPKKVLPFHPNGMKVAAINMDGDTYDRWTYYSIGGGDIICMESPIEVEGGDDLYGMTNMTDIMNWCEKTGKSYWEYVNETEDPAIWKHLEEVWKVMKAAVERGIEEEGVLPGPLNLRRKALSYHVRAFGQGDTFKTRGLVFAYALCR